MLSKEYKLIQENHDGTKDILYKEQLVTSIKYWFKFADKVASYIDKPLVRELYMEDYNGKLSLAQPEQANAATRKGLIPLVLFIIISFIGALCYRLAPTSRAFVIFGISSICINLVFFVFYYTMVWDKAKAGFENKIVFVAALLTTIAPSAIMYFIFTFMLSGFRLPMHFW